MADGEQKLELKFRIYDGTDICHGIYAPSATVATLKQILVAEWPQDKATIPKSVNDVKLIHAGRILKNSETLADSQMTFSNLSGEVNTVHVVVQPAISKKKTDKQEEEQKLKSCPCTIL
ncbi:membrane-anchored ubiquitin-fold protein 3-like [Ziziphus jujuba]|uniref:Membrane-anchored ubiquitin-fold protein n=1 Tax=Ziziphus jujuba TaxID=326968 RepID=A0A6P4ARE2_ZIZJJ|nr:membrane-anchored ubiquitin-fold protein 3-like [Ziziphus jujuba]XP_060667562.1 membrane-anchored ubiquitin-fold protein 3-like [Ziziphus jujuba]